MIEQTRFRERNWTLVTLVGEHKMYFNVLFTALAAFNPLAPPSACHDDFMTSIVDIVRGILDTGFKQDFCLYKLGSPANNTGRVEKVMAA
ncbi:hypothetical protein MHU86_347 [Fragilaria crotonensis]|nr:hypothetical protein MHU86_347 [Fragilaria crotonensis]